MILDYTRKEESTIIENLILNVVQRKNTSKNNSGRRLEEKWNSIKYTKNEIN